MDIEKKEKVVELVNVLLEIIKQEISEKNSKTRNEVA